MEDSWYTRGFKFWVTRLLESLPSKCLKMGLDDVRRTELLPKYDIPGYNHTEYLWVGASTA